MHKYNCPSQTAEFKILLHCSSLTLGTHLSYKIYHCWRRRLEVHLRSEFLYHRLSNVLSIYIFHNLHSYKTDILEIWKGKNSKRNKVTLTKLQYSQRFQFPIKCICSATMLLPLYFWLIDTETLEGRKERRNHYRKQEKINSFYKVTDEAEVKRRIIGHRLRRGRRKEERRTQDFCLTSSNFSVVCTVIQKNWKKCNKTRHIYC